jgi:hypothetical protein
MVADAKVRLMRRFYLKPRRSQPDNSFQQGNHKNNTVWKPRKLPAIKGLPIKFHGHMVAAKRYS